MIRQIQNQSLSETVCRRLSATEPSVCAPVTILVIESNHLLRNALKQGLRENGFIVSVAADRSEAVALYTAFKGGFDLVLTESRLPGQDGIEVVKVLNDVTPIARLCFMTSDAQEGTLAQLTDVGALYVFIKPFLMADFFEKLLFLSRLSASPLTIASKAQESGPRPRGSSSATPGRPESGRRSISFRMPWDRGFMIRTFAALTRLCVWLPRRRYATPSKPPHLKPPVARGTEPLSSTNQSTFKK